MSRLASSLAPAVVEELFRKADAGRWTLSREEFAAVVDASIERGFASGVPSGRDLERYAAGLHVEDLALAAACALGRETAWDHFVLTHRPVLYRAADALDPSGGAREIADALYADLYGMTEAEGERRSLFRYFHGRSSLPTWLRAVLAQRHVDSLRLLRRLEPLPEEERESAPSAGAPSRVSPPPGDPDRPRLVRLVQDALRVAVDRLDPKDRLRLRSYYVTELTLAQIGRIVGEHEATVSRALTRTRRGLRESIRQQLREREQLTAAQVDRAVELALEDPGELDLRHVTEPDRKEPGRNRST